ncbi:MAG: ECF transporter S component [Clostridia bacterium]|nr:ECF transporter S component [Clostridia bacterium]
MEKISTRKVVLTGLMIALVFITTKFTSIPIGIGYFNIGDSVIIITAVLFGSKSGFLAGALGSTLADLSSGYAYYAPITFIVKGIEGFLIGAIASRADETKKGEIIRVLSVVSGIIVMIVGYYLGDLFGLKFVGQNYGLAVANLNVQTNLIQGISSIVVGYSLSALLYRNKSITHLIRK